MFYDFCIKNVLRLRSVTEHLPAVCRALGSALTKRQLLAAMVRGKQRHKRKEGGW